jgi:putative alpha-1,2-mannosidase
MVGLGLVLVLTNVYAGYPPDGEFTGFSMMHLSGTGGVPMYGVVSQLPIAGQIVNPLDVRVGSAAPGVAEVGSYSARTSDEVVVEPAATDHAAMY